MSVGGPADDQGGCQKLSQMVVQGAFVRATDGRPVPGVPRRARSCSVTELEMGGFDEQNGMTDRWVTDNSGVLLSTLHPYSYISGSLGMVPWQ